LGKLKERDPELYDRLGGVKRIDFHPIFYRISGDKEDWET
jgi:hypothetical protein